MPEAREARKRTAKLDRGSSSQCRLRFGERVKFWAHRIGVRPRRVRWQAMRRKWASCSAGGTLTFSDKLPWQPKAFREYVIVHELLHLVVRNHGRLFKAMLRAYLPHDVGLAQGVWCGAMTRKVGREGSRATCHRTS